MGWVGVAAVADAADRAVAEAAIGAAGGIARGFGEADVVVVDGVDGCRRARGAGDAWVVAVGAGGEEWRAAVWAAGADAVVPPAELAEQLRALMRRAVVRVPRPRAAEDVRRVGRLEVDAGRRVVRAGGVEVPLTRTEFDLLLTMTGAPAQVWRRDALAEAVWGDRWATDRHVVEVHVGNLRRKLGAAAGGTWIRTVRGVGYRLEEQVRTPIA